MEMCYNAGTGANNEQVEVIRTDPLLFLHFTLCSSPSFNNGKKGKVEFGRGTGTAHKEATATRITTGYKEHYRATLLSQIPTITSYRINRMKINLVCNSFHL